MIVHVYDNANTNNHMFDATVERVPCAGEWVYDEQMSRWYLVVSVWHGAPTAVTVDVQQPQSPFAAFYTAFLKRTP